MQKYWNGYIPHAYYLWNSIAVKAVPVKASLQLAGSFISVAYRLRKKYWKACYERRNLRKKEKRKSSSLALRAAFSIHQLKLLNLNSKCMYISFCSWSIGILFFVLMQNIDGECGGPGWTVERKTSVALGRRREEKKALMKKKMKKKSWRRSIWKLNRRNEKRRRKQSKSSERKILSDRREIYSCISSEGNVKCAGVWYLTHSCIFCLEAVWRWREKHARVENISAYLWKAWERRGRGGICSVFCLLLPVCDSLPLSSLQMSLSSLEKWSERKLKKRVLWSQSLRGWEESIPRLPRPIEEKYTCMLYL